MKCLIRHTELNHQFLLKWSNSLSCFDSIIILTPTWFTDLADGCIKFTVNCIDSCWFHWVFNTRHNRLFDYIKWIAWVLFRVCHMYCFVLHTCVMMHTTRLLNVYSSFLWAVLSQHFKVLRVKRIRMTKRMRHWYIWEHVKVIILSFSIRFSPSRSFFFIGTAAAAVIDA